VVMTNEDILEQQVEALEKLLQLKTAVIEELEAKVSRLEADKADKAAHPYPGVNTPWITQPYIQPYQPNIIYTPGQSDTITIFTACPDGTPHQYPSMWGGTNSPSCAKCGQSNIISAGTTTGHFTTSPNGNSNVTIGTPQNITLTGAQCNLPVHTSGYAQTVDLLDPTQNNVFALQNAAK
jgi:hypothetical protein